MEIIKKSFAPIVIVIISAYFLSCYFYNRDNRNDPNSDNYIGIVATHIEITVTNGDLINSNKDIDAPSVELWAVTTNYLTPGYEDEKVKLTGAGGTYTGSLPVVGGGSRTVIIFDDVFTNPHPYNGTYPDHDNAGTGNHDLIITDDVFSPCSVLLSDGTPFADAFAATLAANSNANATWTTTHWTSFSTPPTSPTTFITSTVTNTFTATIFPPRLPGLDTVTVTTPSEYNDEVYTLFTNVNPGDTLTADYTVDFTKSSAYPFCECQRSIVLNTAVSAAVTYNPYFTDDNFNQAGGGCPTP